MYFNKPKFWDYKRSNYLSYLLLPFTVIIIFSNWIDQFFLKKKFKIKTICVGNIYLGGTGKTPISIEIFKILKKFGFRSAFIKKNYSAHKDEIKLLSKVGPVISMRSRKDSIEYAESKKFKRLIIDDGLQDKSINYDLKIVCFNKKNFIGNGRLIPAGPLREKLNSLKKYDIVLLNGPGTCDPKIKRKIRKINKKLTIFETYPVITNKNKINKKRRYLLFSGIGNPNSFPELLSMNDFKISETIVFPDHYDYSFQDIVSIKERAKILDLRILTTEKDYLRIDKKDRSNINFVKLKFKIKNEKKFIKLLIS